MTDAERSAAESREAAAFRARAAAAERSARAARLAADVRAHKERSARLRRARRALRLMAAEWRLACDRLDDVCDLMRVDRGPLAGLLGDHRRPDSATLAAYFALMDQRMNRVLCRLYCVQHKCWGRRPRSASAADSVSTASEQEDEFAARDLDDPENNRQAKLMSAVDPTALPIDARHLRLGPALYPCPV